MTRDIIDRLTLFGAGVDVQRIALNMDQIRQYTPPPNPVKIDPETKQFKDTRAKKYVEKYGLSSWELDALRPEVLDGLITAAIKSNLDQKKYNQAIDRQEAEREHITALLPLMNDATGRGIVNQGLCP
jgi:hypothetical protein